MKNRKHIKTFEDKTSLILSGEGGHQTEHKFVMELNTLEEANVYFDKLKKGEFDGTYLFIYEAKKLREE